MIHVHAAPQRKAQRARGISSGTTFFFVSASIVGTKFELTKLKNQRWPIHRMPAKTWAQRKRDSRRLLPSMSPPSDETGS